MNGTFDYNMSEYLSTLPEPTIHLYEENETEIQEDLKDFSFSICIRNNVPSQSYTEFVISLDSYKVGTIKKTQSLAQHYSNGPPQYITYTHTLTIDMLYNLKELWEDYSSTSSVGCTNSNPFIEKLIKEMITNPKYFMSNVYEFEEKTQKLEKLIEEQRKHLNYFKELARNKRIVRMEEKRLVFEKKKLEEERQYLLAVKQKLSHMKKDLDEQEARLNTINLDEFN